MEFSGDFNQQQQQQQQQVSYHVEVEGWTTETKARLTQINSPLSVAFAAGGLQVSHGPVEDVRQ